jgi:hypothetical protein
METDIRHTEPSSWAFEREKLASAEQWANWTTDQIRSAVEAERERTFELLTELLGSPKPWTVFFAKLTMMPIEIDSGFASSNPDVVVP